MRQAQPLWRSGPAPSHHDLAIACRTTGRTDEAIALHEQALTELEGILGSDHIDTLISGQQPRHALMSRGPHGQSNWFEPGAC
jgi:hypothetical protein